jgi:SAM-dependent methyltransferase
MAASLTCRLSSYPNAMDLKTAFYNFLHSSEGPPIPPASLRARVNGCASAIEHFVLIGAGCAYQLQELLARHGFKPEHFDSILDFGVGCGRTLRYLVEIYPTVKFFGVDVDKEAIEWCQRNLKKAQCSIGAAQPPLNWPDASFDFIYGLSVFTHINLPSQVAWTNEFARLLKPGGALLLSYNGRHVFEQNNLLPASAQAEYQQTGCTFIKTLDDPIFPDWYQTTFSSEPVMRSLLVERFEVLEFRTRGLMGSQDLVLARRHAG